MKNDLSLEGGRGRNLCVGGECYNEQLKSQDWVSTYKVKGNQ